MKDSSEDKITNLESALENALAIREKMNLKIY